MLNVPKCLWLLSLALTLEPLYVESHGGDDNRGPLLGLLKVVDNGGLSAVVQSDHEDIHLLFAHLQHGCQLIKETHGCYGMELTKLRVL